MSGSNRTPEAIVVLGCKVRADGTPGAAAERRVRVAAKVFRESGAGTLVASGGRLWHGHAEADVLARRLAELGVPEGAIVRELSSLTTLQNAAFSAPLLRERGMLRATIVTCDFHCRRAVRCFEWMGISAVAVAAPSPHRSPARRALRAIAEGIRGRVDRYLARDWISR